MTKPKLISLFSGYGGLDMGVARALGGADTVVTSDLEPGPVAIEAFHTPGIPNLGDITAVDKSTLPEADILVGGSPCQSMSYAGRRAGMHEGTRSGLWSEQCDAINAVRPRLTVWENVQAATGASASSRSDIVRHGRRVAALRAAGLCACDNPDLDYPAGFRPPTGEGAVRADKALLDWARRRGLDVSGLECRRCGCPVYGPGPVAWTDRLGGRDTGPVIRALGRVLADLSLIGYDAVWRGIEAADVGAPHHRFRLFVVAWPQTPPDRPAETDLFRELDALPAPRPAGSPWAVFDRDADVWRSGETRLDGTADVFDGVWPTDGVMVSGRVWTAPAWPAVLPRLSGAPARHGDTDPRHRVSGSPLIPTPAARDAKGLNQRRNQENLPGAMELGTRLRSAPATMFLPTPHASDGAKGPSYSGHRVNLSGAILGQAGLLPTPTASDGMAERMRTGMWHAGSRRAMNLGIAGRIVTAGESKARDPESYGFRVDWGRFTPAVRRWETILGRPAPDPTQATRRLRVLAGRLPARLRDGAWCARRIQATLPHGVDWPCKRRVIDRWAAAGAPGLIDPVWRSIASRDPDDPVGCTRLPARSVLDLWFQATHTRVTVANLSPRLAEWMMGLPAGWVTDPAIWRNVPGNHRMLQLRALGNGVCPPQAERAVRDALDLRRKLSR
ncbi:DNA cytosine methyltransferase [Bifidobacterium boum]|uniref:DNA cytosine methyltransferase n=1 Tax=Bifidobacterium boum TaxID=78343 RepID=UPI0039964AB0